MNFRDQNSSDEIYACFGNAPYRPGTKYTQKISPINNNSTTTPTVYSSRKANQAYSYEPNYPNPRSYSSQKISNNFHGIANLCNTCWMGSSLQILLNIPQFVSDLCNTDLQQCSVSLLNELSRLFIQYSITTNRNAVNPEDFYKTLRSRIPSLSDGQQHDVAEFLQLLAENCQEDIFSSLKSPGKNSFSRTRMFSSDPFMKNFGFTMIGKIVCSQCHTVVSQNVQSNFIFQLPFVNNSLESCIRHSFEPEQFELKSKASKYGNSIYSRYYHDPRYSGRSRVRSDNQTVCPRCRNQISFQLENTIYRLPRFLFIQIERFDDSLEKNSARVDFPSTLNMSDYVDGNYYTPPDPITIIDNNQIDIDSLSTKIALRESSLTRSYRYETHCSIEEDENLKRKTSRLDCNYKLIGVILHQGDYSFGHYMAAFPNGFQDWTIISDDIVAPNQTLDKSLPYCFIYQKC